MMGGNKVKIRIALDLFVEIRQCIGLTCLGFIKRVNVGMTVH